MVLGDEGHHGVGETATKRAEELLFFHVERSGVTRSVSPSLTLRDIVEVFLPAGGVHHMPAGAGVRSSGQVGSQEGKCGRVLHGCSFRVSSSPSRKYRAALDIGGHHQGVRRWVQLFLFLASVASYFLELLMRKNQPDRGCRCSWSPEAWVHFDQGQGRQGHFHPPPAPIRTSTACGPSAHLASPQTASNSQS